ncbi:glycosyltransferase family 2 protein [Agromyces silvae]|uniref:glycosyltransferase family 2 protein n=1 Tax=Agromyces silvae TaxID=3388266 RepID=UPI00280A9D01|nr:glycosyltransferase family 2 protein [Agromyces protaetiae]
MSDARDRRTGVIVVTVLYRSGDELAGFVDSARSSAGDVELEIVAVNNSAEDADDARRRAEALGVRFVQAPGNLGYGGGINHGLATVPHAGRPVLIANPDVRFLGDAIPSMLDGLQHADSDVAAVGPRIVDADGIVYPSARRLPSVSTGVGHALLGSIAPSNPWTQRYRAIDDYTRDRDVEWLSGACLLIRAAWFDTLDGFDTSYFMYFEDVDLGARIQSNGGRNRFVAAATVQHTGAHSTSTSADAMLRAHHRSAALFLSRRYGRWYQAPLRAALRCGLYLRSTILTRPGRRTVSRTSKKASR